MEIVNDAVVTVRFRWVELSCPPPSLRKLLLKVAHHTWYDGNVAYGLETELKIHFFVTF